MDVSKAISNDKPYDQRLRWRGHTPIGMMRVLELLTIIGIPAKMIYADKNRIERRTTQKQFFFDRKNENECYEVLCMAHDLYRKQIKKFHPDKNGDTVKAAELNAVWARIKLLFKRRGFTL